MASGYLKVLDCQMVDEDNEDVPPMYEFTLTNREVRSMVRGRPSAILILGRTRRRKNLSGFIVDLYWD